MSTTIAPPAPPVAAEPKPAGGGRRGRWIDDWRPEDTGYWNAGGDRVARRNLFWSVT